MQLALLSLPLPLPLPLSLSPSLPRSLFLLGFPIGYGVPSCDRSRLRSLSLSLCDNMLPPTVSSCLLRTAPLFAFVALSLCMLTFMLNAGDGTPFVQATGRRLAASGVKLPTTSVGGWEAAEAMRAAPGGRDGSRDSNGGGSGGGGAAGVAAGAADPLVSTLQSSPTPSPSQPKR